MSINMFLGNPCLFIKAILIAIHGANGSQNVSIYEQYECENPKEIRYGSSVVLGCCQVNEHYKPGSQSCVSCAPRWTNCAKNTEIQCSHHLVFWPCPRQSRLTTTAWAEHSLPSTAPTFTESSQISPTSTKRTLTSTEGVSAFDSYTTSESAALTPDDHQSPDAHDRRKESSNTNLKNEHSILRLFLLGAKIFACIAIVPLSAAIMQCYCSRRENRT